MGLKGYAGLSASFLNQVLPHDSFVQASAKKKKISPTVIYSHGVQLLQYLMNVKNSPEYDDVRRVLGAVYHHPNGVYGCPVPFPTGYVGFARYGRLNLCYSILAPVIRRMWVSPPANGLLPVSGFQLLAGRSPRCGLKFVGFLLLNSIFAEFFGRQSAAGCESAYHNVVI